MEFILTLGYPKRDHVRKHDWNKYKEGALQIINWETGTLLREDRYVSPPGRVVNDGNILFKAGTLHGKKFFVPSATEILVYELPRLRIKEIYSHPSFNDLHHVTVHNNIMYICNTGLEIIQVMNLDGDIVAEYNVAASDTWERFSRETDYRLVVTTKPHESHANYIFFLEGEIWCTRFLQRDAVCIGNPSKRINLNVSKGGPHDGLVRGDFIYFTLTDGYVVIVNKYTLKLEDVIDLNLISNYNVLLGWCRGIEVIGKNAYVGFTALRWSKYREYGLWIKRGKKRLGSRIAEYDLQAKTLVKEVPVARDTGAAIFTVRDISSLM